MNTELAEAGAHGVLGSTRLWRGEFAAAREHLERATAIYDRNIA